VRLKISPPLSIAQLDVDEQQRHARGLQKFCPEAAGAIVAASMTPLLTGGDRKARREHFDSRRLTREAYKVLRPQSAQALTTCVEVIVEPLTICGRIYGHIALSLDWVHDERADRGPDFVA
jgi:hypothetical protein